MHEFELGSLKARYLRSRGVISVQRRSALLIWGFLYTRCIFFRCGTAEVGEPLICIFFCFVPHRKIKGSPALPSIINASTTVKLYLPAVLAPCVVVLGTWNSFQNLLCQSTSSNYIHIIYIYICAYIYAHSRAYVCTSMCTYI